MTKPIIINVHMSVFQDCCMRLYPINKPPDIVPISKETTSYNLECAVDKYLYSTYCDTITTNQNCKTLKEKIIL